MFRANGKLNFCRRSLFIFVYSRVKLFVFGMNGKGHFSIVACFIYGLEEKKLKSEVIFAVFRLPLTSCLTSLLRCLFVKLCFLKFSFQHV